MRPALLLAVLIGRAVAHAQVGLGVLGGHTDEAGDPNPEQRTRATDGKRGGHANDIAGTDGRGEGGRERLVVGKVSGTFTAFVNEGVAHCAAERAELQAAEANSQVQAGAKQQRHEDERAPDDAGNPAQKIIQR